MLLIVFSVLPINANYIVCVSCLRVVAEDWESYVFVICFLSLALVNCYLFDLSSITCEGSFAQILLSVTLLVPF